MPDTLMDDSLSSDGTPDFFKRQYDALLRLAKSTVIDEGNPVAAIQEVLVIAAETLQCERISLWFYTDDESAITCFQLYERLYSRFSSGDRLYARDYPAYFRYLHEERFLSAEDAATNPATAEFAAVYLYPNHIISMLDAPVRLKGKMIGILCNEECAAPRRWTPEEQNFAASITDIITRALLAADRRKAEDEVRYLNQNLERLVAEKTSRLQEAFNDLQEKNRMLHRFSREKSALLGIVAHDLSNPLTAISNFADVLISHTPQGSREHQYALLIKDLAHNAVYAIRQVLTAAAVESGRVELRPRRLDLAPLVRLVCAMNESQAERKSQTVSIEQDADCYVQGDEDRLREVIDNLLSNAIKYSPPNTPIFLTVKKTDTLVRLAVTDTGQGLTAEDLSKLFTEFQRLSAKPTGGETSTGLGLTIVKKLVELHGGTVRAESAGKDQGATFSVELPLAPRPAASFM